MVSNMRGFFDIELAGIDGGEDLAGGLRLRAILIVIVASACGFTPQYGGGDTR
jgi:glutathione peroxidase-family protein